MKGLLKKEVLSAKTVLKSYLSAIIFLGVLSYFTKNIMFLTMIIPIYSLNQVLVSMSYDELSQWNQYALTLPIKRRDIVKSKYIFFLILILSISIIILLVFRLIFPRLDMTIIEFISFYIGSIVTVFIFFSLLMPILYKLGLEKGRIIVMGILAFIYGIAFTGAKIIANYFTTFNVELFIRSNYQILLMAILPIILLIYLVSMMFSIKIFERTDL